MIIDPRTFEFPAPQGFIVLEGVNGAGKSTLAGKIDGYLRGRGIEPLLTHEPGGSQLGAPIRKLLLESEDRCSPRAELLLFTADRAEHVDRIIRPALAAGTPVISDRYYYSSEAFQGYGRGLELEALRGVNAFAVDGCIPDLVLLLDLDPEEGLRRTRKRSGGAAVSDQFEVEELAFHHRLRDGFLEIARSSKEPFLVLDAQNSAEQLLQETIPALERWADGLSGNSR